MDQTTVCELVRRTSVFGGCSDLTAARIAALPVDAFSAGDMIGGTARLGIIVSGKVRIFSADGGHVLMKEASEGDIFGAATVFLDYDGISEVVAKTRCEIIFVDEKTLEQIFASDAAVAVSYVKFLSERVAFLNKKVASLSSPRADIALASYICEASAGKREFKLNCLAASKKLGIGRTSVYRALKMLEDDGLICFEKGIIIIKDEAGLSSRRNKK